VFLDALPQTPSGKVDRKSLPLPSQERPELVNEFITPRTPIEKTIADIWRNLLKIERVGIYDNFFELGGHSLLATRLINRVFDVFQIQLPLKALWESPTIADMAVAILQAKADRLDEKEVNQILDKIEASAEK
jgi:acyl carrier protein